MTGTPSCPGGTVPSGHELGGRCPVSRTNAAYCAFVTGILPIRNGATSTTCRGLSSAAGRIGTRRIAAHAERPRRDEAPFDLGHVCSGITGRRMWDGRSAST